MADAAFNYRSLLANADAEARNEYDFDPRIALMNTANPGLQIDPANNVQPTATLNSLQPTIQELTDAPETMDTLSLPVQQPPDMVTRRRMVIIDTAQRDWTLQPDAYSNVFSFGTQLPMSNIGPQVPYYFNNPTVPLAAYQTPRSALRIQAGKQQQTIANITPIRFGPSDKIPSYFSTIDQGLVTPTYGWSIVTLNGEALHFPDPIPYGSAGLTIFYYPTHNPELTAGAQIGIDRQASRYGVNDYIFSTQLALSNVTDIKLLRAVMPVRGTQPYQATAFTGGIAYPNAFHMQPYVLMTIQNIKGNYYGGSQIVQNSFSVLTQNTRNMYEGGSVLPSQFSDYYPLGDESYTFDPPLARMSNANIQVYNNAGIPFSQVDRLNVVAMKFDTSIIGSVQLFVTQNTTTVSGGLTDSNAFLKTDIRVGDEIKFYSPILTQFASDVSCIPQLSALAQLMSNNFLITGISSNDFKPSFTFPFSDVGTSFTAVPKLLSGYAGMSNAVATICSVLQSVSQISFLQYSGVTQSGLEFMNRRTFSIDYPIPMMNLNTQATFVLEVTTLEPNPTNIKKIIPN
uniref:Uncharacterized protein n=1 Tax=viral metagenome TaxID=1070528 RepID=A0A6C0K8S7_9ZZZZ